MKELIAIQILGLTKQEQLLVSLLLELHKSNRFGEIPGRNLRHLLELTKDSLFLVLERLAQKNILKKYTHTAPDNVIYLKGGESHYVFNYNYNEWIPSSDSLLYKLCKILGLRYNTLSYNYIVDSLDIRQEFVEHKNDSDTIKITPYEVYEMFCKEYKTVFNKDYKPLNQNKDFQTIKNIICKFSFNNIKETYIQNFIRWCFSVKARNNKGDFIIGFYSFYICFLSIL